MGFKEREWAAMRAELASLDESAKAVLRKYGGAQMTPPKPQTVAPVPSGVGIFVGITNFRQYDI